MALFVAGCGGMSADELQYKGDEEAVKEHMREFDDTERLRFAEIKHDAPPASGDERNGPQSELARQRN